MRLDFLNKNIMGKKGFTLAELMIVLAVLAVIAAVLMPTVFNSMPDENKLKFKKGYYTLKSIYKLIKNKKLDFNVFLNARLQSEENSKTDITFKDISQLDNISSY